MKTIKLLLVFNSIFLFSNLHAQTDLSDFDKFAGIWEGSYVVEGWNNIETMTNKWILDGKYFQMEITGYEKDNPENKYYNLSIFTLDKDDNIIGWYFNNNGYRQQHTWKGSVKNNVVGIAGKNSSGSTKMTFEIKDGKLINKREYNFGNPIKNEVVFTKK